MVLLRLKTDNGCTLEDGEVATMCAVVGVAAFALEGSIVAHVSVAAAIASTIRHNCRMYLNKVVSFVLETSHC
jgi:hypothetical protein